MDLAYLIAHPQELNQETLYDLRRLVAVYPTFHAARILFLQNLFLLHDPLFDQELRRAALLVPDRRVLFDLTHNIAKFSQMNVKAVKRQPTPETKPEETEQRIVQEPIDEGKPTEEISAGVSPHEVEATTPESPHVLPEGNQKTPKKKYTTNDTTARLLDNFLASAPTPLAKKRIKADPSTDYMAYLLQQDETETAQEPTTETAAATDSTSRLDELIDSFIASSSERIMLSDDPMIPEEFRDNTDEVTEKADAVIEDVEDDIEDVEDDFEDVEDDFEEEEIIEEVIDDDDTAEETIPTPAATRSTATTESGQQSSELSEQLAQIYIKQGKYERAIEILNKISVSDSATHNPYLADQMRFLQKLASLNAKNNKSK